MRILFYIEPVIFRSEPAHLTAHLPWAHIVRRAVQGSGGSFALASNVDICAAWRDQCQALRAEPGSIWHLDPFLPLSTYGWKRSCYAKALYDEGADFTSLESSLHRIRRLVMPDIVVSTSQSAFIRRVFSDALVLNAEQSILPRRGQPHRITFDPMGYQTNSVFDVYSEEIRKLQFADDLHQEALSVFSGFIEGVKREPKYSPAKEAIETIRNLFGGRTQIALLVTQPPDWSTYEGAYDSIDVECLLVKWAADLPDGWVGIPTYHPGFRLNSDLERAVARSCPNIRFLPPELSQGTTEILLPLVEGMVSISSTASTTGILLGKKVVAAGRCQFSSWVASNVEDIELCPTFNRDEVARIILFLTHRYSHLKKSFDDHPNLFIEFADSLSAADSKDLWFMDTSEVSPLRLRSMFNF